MSIMNLKKISIKELGVSPADLGKLLKMIDSKVISGKMAKSIFKSMSETCKSAEEIIEKSGLRQLDNKDELSDIIDKVLSLNSDSVKDYLGGKEKAFMFLIGQIMKETKGKAEPKLANELLSKKLATLKNQ